MVHRLAALLVLTACTGGVPATDDAETGVDDTGTPACDEIVPPGFDVWLEVDEDVFIGPEDIRWTLGAASGYCSLESDGRWHCDTGGALGVAELRIEVSGHLPVVQAVDVQEYASCYPQIDVTLERLGPAFDEDRAYYIQWIEDDDECARSWELYAMNCFATAVFCADGDAEVIVTDIISSGVYGVEGTTISGFFPDASGEIAEDESFLIESDATLRDATNGYAWTLDVEDRFTASVCREGGA
ncbi:MAG: hypothetical protein Q8P18_02760 [Pseudomonadota bacterium]|nr:hypothetical protein [Pseudomonadota bacterium]